MSEEQTWFEHRASSTRKFSIYLPSRKKSGEPVDGFGNLATAILELLCETFGGATSYEAQGIFKRKEADLQNEEIRLIECFCRTDEWESHAPVLRALVGMLARILDQESIACSLDGRMVFVSPARAEFASSLASSGKELRSLVDKVMAGGS